MALTPNQIKQQAKSNAVKARLIAEGTLIETKHETKQASQGNVTDYSKVAKDSIPASASKPVHTPPENLRQPINAPEKSKKAPVQSKPVHTPTDVVKPIVVAPEKKEEAPMNAPEIITFADIESESVVTPVPTPVKAKSKKAVMPADLVEYLDSIEKVELESDPAELPQGMRFSDIAEVEQTWISKRLALPTNEVVFLNGVGGIGKTTLLCHLAACVSSGAPFGWNEECMRSPVIICAPEDSAETTLVKRLKDTGCADLKNIINLSHVKIQGGDRLHTTSVEPFRLPRDFKVLAEMIHAVKPNMVFIDNVTTCFEKYTSPTYVREHITNVLTELAHTLEVCFVIVNHVYDNGKAGGKAVTKGASTLGDAARVNILATLDESDSKWVIMRHSKINLASEMEPLRYTRKKVEEKRIVLDSQGVEKEVVYERMFIQFWNEDEKTASSEVGVEEREKVLSRKIMMLLFREYIGSLKNDTPDYGLPRHQLIKALCSEHSNHAVAMALKRLLDKKVCVNSGYGWYKLSDDTKNAMLQISACQAKLTEIGIDVKALPQVSTATLKQLTVSATAK